MRDSDEQRFYPLLFEPVLKDYIWGGRTLAERLGRALPEGQDVAESWEIAAHTNGDVEVANGSLLGATLSELLRTFGRRLIGNRGAWALERGKFPLLIKLLDAHRKLSVQVHPDDDYARKHEGNELGKTEMWVVLHAEDDAAIILGVKSDTTSKTFREALDAGQLEQHLHEIPLTTGDFVCVPSGSLHAILGGLLIVEIQQNSDVTYRVYDWNRLGHDGNPRQLHVDKAMEVIDFGQVEPSLPNARLIEEDATFQRWELCRNSYFCVERYELAPNAELAGQCDGSTMHVWGIIDGEAAISGGAGSIDGQAVQFTLLPASLGDYVLRTAGQRTTFLKAYLT